MFKNPEQEDTKQTTQKTRIKIRGRLHHETLRTLSNFQLWPPAYNHLFSQLLHHHASTLESSTSKGQPSGSKTLLLTKGFHRISISCKMKNEVKKKNQPF